MSRHQTMSCEITIHTAIVVGVSTARADRVRASHESFAAAPVLR